jgi:aminoglycoside 6-adenylyltransferase
LTGRGPASDRGSGRPRPDAYDPGVDHRRTLDELVLWATDEENIRLVVLTGSLAREPGEADPLSDIDIELYVREPDALLRTRDWYRRFGQVVAVEELENEGWHPTRLVYFVGAKVDFMIGPVGALEAGVSYRHGFRVLLDKDRLGGRLSAETAPWTPPAPEEFRRCVDWFSAAAIMSAKAIARGEPWIAKGRDRDLKDELLRMIEWDHRCRYGQDYDTWYQGAHMREWMDVDVQASLELCWAGFSLEDTAGALEHSFRLFERLGAQTAEALGIEGFDLRRVRGEVNRLLPSSPPR